VDSTAPYGGVVIGFLAKNRRGNFIAHSVLSTKKNSRSEREFFVLEN